MISNVVQGIHTVLYCEWCFGVGVDVHRRGTALVC